MPTVSDIRALGSTLTTVANPIIEPLNAPPLFNERLRRFGGHYDLSNKSHLYRYLVSLCGDAGVGALKKELLVGRLQQQLEATHFLDLDNLYGNPLAFPRLSSEIYSIDPQNEILTSEQWTEVFIKDASYRARCLLWMRAIIEGSSLAGMKLAAEAAIGVECDIFENYRYIETPTIFTNLAQTSSRNEFVIIPRTTSITLQEQRRIMKLTDKLKPVNSLQTTALTTDVRNKLLIIDVAATSERFYVAKFVTGQADVKWPSVDTSQGFWIESGVEKEAPTFAFMNRQDSVTYLSIDDVAASSEQIGFFNKIQQTLFAHLKTSPSAYYEYSPVRSYAKNIAPVNMTIPWIGRNDAPHNNVIINNHYPIGYFTESNVNSFIQPVNETFWASTEKLAPATEELVFDFERERPINFIDFQICLKPIDFIIEYWTGSTWDMITPKEGFPVTMAVDYLPSEIDPWYYFEVYFEKLLTQKIRISFTRREQVFPLVHSDPFPWSIEVREARFMHVIHTADEFIADSGQDILNNSFRTELINYPATATVIP